MPLVSVILPSYNHARFLRQRIESILSQTYKDFELIIIDDCSTDNSLAIAEGYKNDKRVTHIVRNETNSGSTFAQWLKGVQLSKGKFIWIAESDDFCERNFLETALMSLQSGSDLFYAESKIVDESGNEKPSGKSWYDDLSLTRWRNSFSNNSSDEVSEFLSVKNTIPNASAVVFRRTKDVELFIKEIQGMRYCGDWLFWMKYLRSVNRIAYSVETTNYFRSHGGVTRRNTDHAKRNNEIVQVLQFVLQECKPLRSTKELVHYYCREHFTAYKGVRSVTNLFFTLRMLFTSKHFWSGWNAA